MTAVTTATGSLHISDEFEPLQERLEKIAPLLAEHGAQIDETGELTAEVVQALRDSGVLKVTVPEVFGGYEFSPRQIIQTVERLARAEASTAWVVMALGMETGTTAAYLGEETARELYGHGEHPLHAGQGTKPGTAQKVEGGYRVSGSWSFASGIHFASRTQTAAFCPETGQALMTTIPVSEATLIENWDVMGLKATRSIDYTYQDVFVPEEHTWPAATTQVNTGGAVYSIGVVNFSGLGHSGWALGASRRLLDELAAHARKRSGGPGSSVDNGQFHAAYAEAEARLRSARAFLLDVWRENEETLDRGELLSTEQETLTRLALNNATWTAHHVAQTAHTWSTTSAIRPGALQRYFRDVNTGTQHVTSSPLVLQGCGRQLAGLAPGEQWLFLELVPEDGTAENASADVPSAEVDAQTTGTGG